MGLIEAIIKLLFYNITTVKEIIPNLLLGIATGVVSSAFLYRLSIVDKEYITFEKKDFIFFLVILSAGVVATSPLGAGGIEWKKILSVLFCLVCLSVCSFTDSKTGTVIVGYVLLGMILQVVLLWWHITSDGLKINYLEKRILIILLVLFFIFVLLRAYTLADLGLIYMNMMCILICSDRLHYVLGILMLFTAFITVVIRDIFFRIPRWKKGGKNGKLQFPFTIHIQAGMMLALFFV